jgi:hypothetical protein
MAVHTVELVATPGVFRGLSKQNLLFHQCIGELCDNAIAATPVGKKFRVDVVFRVVPNSPDVFDLYIADNCRGMSLENLKEALQLGESPASDSRLNEHGFGLKNSLATLSGGNGPWSLWSKQLGSTRVCKVDGPFATTMEIDDEVASLPQEPFLPADISTLIKVRCKVAFLQTVQGRGAPSKDLFKLRDWLIEHLGVLYRGYLEPDENTYEDSGSIHVSIDNDSIRVAPISVPIGDMKTKYFQVELSGTVYKLHYRFGTLDTEKRDHLLKGQPARFYYQGNQPTQGIDIRLGKRVIATRQFETIWKTENKESKLDRHNRYNDFVGEVIIPEVPRGVLTTVNNKTDFNLDDRDWEKIFDELNNHRPPQQVREKSESELRDKWMQMLRVTTPADTVTDERSVWPTGTRIDVYRETPAGTIIIYELKVGTGSPLHLYQLKMYWDGLVLEGKQPKEGILMVDEFNTALEEMANKMNKLTPPAKTQPYNFKIEKLKDKGL